MTTDYYDCLKHVSCDVLLVFGTDDPWCKPAFAKSMIEALEDRERTTTAMRCPPPIHRYFEISRAGHCPNHESPRAVSHLIKEWTQRCDDNEQREQDSEEQAAFPQPERFRPPISFAEEWGSPMTVRERRKEDIKVGWVDKIVTKVM